MVDSNIFRVRGVSLPVPPWPNNPIHSAAVLLHPTNVKRLGRSLESNNVYDRQRRIYINLVVLFRLLTRCQHLAFDHDNFWSFIQHHWGVPNVSPDKTEDLVNVYSDRRRVYTQARHIKRKHHDLLTDLIDAWNTRNIYLSPPSRPSRQEIDAQWDSVKTWWLEQLRHNSQSLLDESNPPHIGTFPVRKGSSPAIQVEGGSNRPLSERITVPPLDRSRECSAKSNSHPAGSPAQKVPERAIDDLINAEGRKRRLASDPTNPAKRQCVPEKLPSSCLPRPEPQSASELHKAVRQGRENDSPREASTGDSFRPAQGVSQHELGAKQADQSPTLSDQIAARTGQHVRTDDSELLKSFEGQIEEHDKGMQMFKEQTNLFLESRKLSRDIQKAHDQLTMLTASKCQEALGRLEELSSQVSALGKNVVACRKSSEGLQKRQTEQQALIQGLQSDVQSVDLGLREAKKDKTAPAMQQAYVEESGHGVKAQCSQLKSRSESHTDIGLQTKQGVEAELRPLQAQLEDQSSLRNSILEGFDERREKIDPIALRYELKVGLEGRLAKMEEAISTSTGLVNNCWTLVEISKTAVDQNFMALYDRVEMLENRFSNYATDQTRISNEQARRLELVEADLSRYKEAASKQLQQKA
ncbi:hypothetical protein LZ30DRAFT_743719 [Colletotrichum cereale]|nr:hypothetical protein LZ30DRAFT_743719 [Colletotrichum cereale]